MTKWINNQVAKELINRIEINRLKPEDGYVVTHPLQGYKSSFKNIESHKKLLIAQARFDSEIPEYTKNQIVNTAIFSAADDNSLNLGYVTEIIKRLEKHYLKKEKTQYCLINRISLSGLKRPNLIDTPHAEIRLSRSLQKHFLRHYDFNQMQKISGKVNEKALTWCVVSIEARCEHSAATLALSELNYWLATINIHYSFGKIRKSFSKPDAVNSLRLFPYHSLHLETGERSSSRYWYNPDYTGSGNSLFADEKFTDAKKLYRHTNKRIQGVQQYRFFRDVFNRYSNALDTKDMQNSFLKLWALLEFLTFTGKDNYETTISRASKVYFDTFMAEQELRYLRDKRNSAIHTSNQIEDAEACTYALLGYIHQLIFSILNFFEHGATTEKIKILLDLPLDRVDLKNLKSTLNEQLNDIALLESLLSLEGNQ